MSATEETSGRVELSASTDQDGGSGYAPLEGLAAPQFVDEAEVLPTPPTGGAAEGPFGERPDTGPVPSDSILPLETMPFGGNPFMPPPPRSDEGRVVTFPPIIRSKEAPMQHEVPKPPVSSVMSEQASPSWSASPQPQMSAAPGGAQPEQQAWVSADTLVPSGTVDSFRSAASEPATPAAPPSVAPTAPATLQPVPAAEKPRAAQAEAEKPTRLDMDVFARNLAQLVEEGGKAMAAYLGPHADGTKKDTMAEDIADALKTVGQVAEYWTADPQRTLEAQSRLMGGYLSVWTNTMKKLMGEQVEPVEQPAPSDKRFKDESWSENPMFDGLKQAYLVTSHWAEDMVREAEGLDDHTRHKAEFLVRQVANAISPSNFVMTNPEVIRETLASSGENLVKGMRNLTEDLIEGKGQLKIRQTDMTAFELGRNLATTPGKVIFENEIMQLIQYEPTTETVKKTPVLIVPPWINKFYILDLTAEKSLIGWMVSQGLTVFTISWVNPDARLAAKSFDDYMREGIMEALDAVAIASGEREVHTIGYCVGGTLLAATLAYMAATGDDRIASSTFLTTQIDFTHAGDLKVFVDEDQIAIIERHMKKKGYLEGSRMANSFNLLRSNDLIWPYVVNNYMKGKAPFPFDLLYWNADSTRMPAANHSYYLRNCYLTNSIARGVAELAGVKVDIPKVKVPVYSLAAKEDHIAPPKSVYIGANLFSGPVRYVLAGSGHIAGVVNPPAKNKYQYWSDGPVGPSYELWAEGSQEHKGSWWPDWKQWFTSIHPDDVPARVVGGGRLTPIEDAPGRYVMARS